MTRYLDALAADLGVPRSWLIEAALWAPLGVLLLVLVLVLTYSGLVG